MTDGGFGDPQSERVAGLRERARLAADLEALRDEPATRSLRVLAAFSLDGLEAYEHEWGVPATYDLLTRLVERLADAIDGVGTAYAIDHGRFAVLARPGRGGTETVGRACAGALTDTAAGIAARSLLSMRPVEMIDPADALLVLMTAAGGDPDGHADASAAIVDAQNGRSGTPGSSGGRPEDGTSLSISVARRLLPPRPRDRSRRLPYLRVSTRFALSVVAGVLWVCFSAWLARPWIDDLGQMISMPAAIAVITGLALVPGYLNVQLVSSLLLDRPVPIDSGHPYQYPKLTLLVAAYDEERKIAQTLAYALEQDYQGGLEVILIDDGSRDDTAAIASGFAQLDQRLRVLGVAHGGKAAALNAGLRATHTPLVATIDADTLLMPGALQRIVARMLVSPADTVAVAGSVMVRNTRGGLVSAAQTWDYLLGIGSIKRQQALLQATLVAQGAFSAYDADALRAAGGWPDCIGEDIVMTWALLNAGGRTTYEPTAIAFTEVPATVRGLARQRRRWARGMIEGLRTYGIALIRRRKAYAHSVIADAIFPYLDFVFTFAFLPGAVLAMTGNFMIVGPMTLAVLPLNGLLASVMYWRQHGSLAAAGLRARRATAGFALFFLLYQVLLSPVSVAGYTQEILHLRRKW